MLFILLIFIGSLGQLRAQVLPGEGSQLYSRLIGFSVPAQKMAVKYKLEIASGNYTDETSFVKNRIISIYSNKPKILAEVPAFGGQYSWRYTFIAKDSAQVKTVLYHFLTRMTVDVDSTITRLRIVKSAEKYKDAYVFVDGTRALYDMKGRPVWVLPGSDRDNSKDAYPRDLKVTPQGTITFVTGYQVYEINYNGKVLWHTAGNTNVANTGSFHHEFTRLRNGNYMGMTQDIVPVKLPAYKDNVVRNKSDSDKYYRSVQSNVLVEYDANYNIVWNWRSTGYLQTSDLADMKGVDSFPTSTDTHENSFYFDEKKKNIYISFRNINRVIKIKYPEGNTLNEYGPAYKHGVKQQGEELFCGQHHCSLTKKGYLCLYNNNTCGPTHIPRIVLMEEPGPGSRNLKKVWEFECPVEGLDTMNKETMSFLAGGGVNELPDGSLLVAVSKPSNQVFIAGLNKKILWRGIPEKFDPATKKWELPTGLFHASMVSRKQLEELIWNAEKK